MHPVTLIYARCNSRRNGVYYDHELSLFLSAEKPALDKGVAVYWGDEESCRWHEAAAQYVCPSGSGRELWRARVKLRRSTGRPPAWIRVCSHGQGAGPDCRIENVACRGILLPLDRQIAALDPCRKIGALQEKYPVSVAVSKDVRAERVFIRWTPDAWKTLHTTECLRQIKARPPEHGAEIWTGLVPLRGAFRIDYAVGCEARNGELWDNNLGLNFRASRPPLKVLTLNLHCYQEDRQEEKFGRIAAAVEKFRIDILCLQEVGELWNRGRGCWNTNAAKKIVDRLGLPYHLLADWSHIGFGRYREGVAILSRYPLLRDESHYISACRDQGCIHARKALMGRVQVPSIGAVNVFSVHLSWWEEGFREQAESLLALAERFREPSVAATLLCGDFNVAPGSEGYRMIAERYEDMLPGAARGHSPAGDRRIDYIFMNRGGGLKAVEARPVFTDADCGRVSDHCGYLIGIEPL